MSVKVRVFVACLVGLAGFGHSAWAMGSCSGSYSASLLRPLPAPLVVGVVVLDNSPRNLQLASRFNAGLQQAGIAISGTPTAQMTLTVTLNSGLGGSDAALVPQQDYSFSWRNGYDLQRPGQTQFGGNRQAPQATTVQLRADLRPSLSEPVAWVATLQCTMQGSDEDQLAFDIGSLLGGGIGKRVDQAPF